MEISFGCSVHSNSKPPSCQKGVRSEGTDATCSAGTWGIAPWRSLVLSTPGCSAAPSQLRGVKKRLDGANHVKIMPAFPRHLKVWSAVARTRYCACALWRGDR